MEPTDLTIEILEGIREDTHAMREGLKQTNEEVCQTNVRLDTLARRTTEHEKRIAATERRTG